MPNQTQIAQELIRIENAKEILKDKAELMQLTATDENGQHKAINDTYNAIEEIAEAFDLIPMNGVNELEVDGPKVTAKRGFFTEDTEQTVKIATRAETTIIAEVDDDDGVGKEKIWIRASNNQEEGYVNALNKTTDRTVNLTIDGRKATASIGDVAVHRYVEEGTYAPAVAKQSGTGKVTAEGKNNTGFKVETDEPTNNEHYIKVTGSGDVVAVGTAKITKTGYLTADEKSTDGNLMSSGEDTKYLVLNDSTFKNGAGETMGLLTIDPLKETSITFDEGYTTGGEIMVAGELLERLQAI